MDALLAQCSKEEQGIANLYALCKFLSNFNLKHHEIKYLYDHTHLSCNTFIRRAENQIKLCGEAIEEMRQYQKEALEHRKKWKLNVDEYHNQIWKKLNGG